MASHNRGGVWGRGGQGRAVSNKVSKQGGREWEPAAIGKEKCGTTHGRPLTNPTTTTTRSPTHPPHLDVGLLLQHVVRREAHCIRVVVHQLGQLPLRLPALPLELVQLGLFQLQLLEQLADVRLLRLAASGACRRVARVAEGVGDQVANIPKVGMVAGERGERGRGSSGRRC